MQWRYIGWRGERFIRRSPTPKAASLRGWLDASFRHARPTEIMPSHAHDLKNPKSLHREGRAVDFYPADDAEGWRAAHTIAAYPDGGDVQMILWKDYQWGGSHGPSWIKTGRTDHDTHLHVEVRP